MKAIALFLCFRLLLVSVLPSQDIHDLTGLVTLIEHFHEHQENDADGHDMSFLDFLSKHYADQEHQDAAGHEDLPFQHNHPSASISYFFAPVTNVIFGAAHFVFRVKPRFHFVQSFFSDFAYSIWQPPKL